MKPDSHWRWLALIAAPTAEEDVYEVSTGGPLSSKYVLMTRHGLGDLNPNMVKLKFCCELDDTDKDWHKADVVWRSDDNGVDAALLELQQAHHVLMPFLPSPAPAQTGANWTGSGFAVARKIESGPLKNLRDTTGVSGAYNPGGLAVSRNLDLNVNDLKIDAAECQGISGGPVMIHYKFVGIITEVEQLAQSSRLVGLPLWKLFDIPAFGSFFDLDTRQAWLTALRDTLIKYLTPLEKTCTVLWEADLLPGLENASSGAIVDKLLTLRAEEVALLLHRAWRRSEIRESIESTPLRKIVGLILPAVYDAATIASTRISSGGVLLRLPASRKSTAEIIMALRSLTRFWRAHWIKNPFPPPVARFLHVAL